MTTTVNHRYGRRDEYWNHRNINNESETINVKSSIVGKLIGRRGYRIRNIEADSNCQIKIYHDYDSSNQTFVKLFGSKHAISKAKRLIQGLQISYQIRQRKGQCGC